jgi:hypothetical protein
MQPSNAWALVHRGLAHRTMRRPEKALADYDRAWRSTRAIWTRSYNRGVVMMDLERAADALALSTR